MQLGATYKRILGILDPRDRHAWWKLSALSVLIGLIEAAGVISILPFLAIAADSSLVTRPGPLKTVYDGSGLTDVLHFQIALGVGVFLFLVGGIALRLGNFYLQTRFARRQAALLSQRLLRRYLHKPYPWFLDQHSSRLGQGILYEVEQVVSGSVMNGMNLIAYAAVAVSVLTVLFLADPVAAVVVGGLLGVAYGGIFLALRKRLQRLGERRVAMNNARFAIVQEALGGIKDVKLRQLEDTFADRFRAPSEKVAQIRARVAVIAEAPRNLLEACAFGAMILFVIWMLALNDGSLAAALPIIGLYAFAGIRLFPVLQRLYRAYAILRVDSHALEGLHAELTAPPPETSADAGNRLRLDDSLTLDALSYRYPGTERNALDRVSLSIAARTTVGIVGPSGSGKSTLLDVILGLLPADEGTLAVDGTPVAGARMAAWQRAIGYVPQSIYLLDDTIAANIAFGLGPDAVDHAALARAAEAAGLSAFLDSLPDGLETRVGERGVRLSGGQRQRIGIARALYHDPDVLAFDEATSALDGLTEREVLDAIGRLGGQKTILMIAHRMTTVRQCDQIFLIEGGRIVDSGSYDALKARSPGFRALHLASGG